MKSQFTSWEQLGLWLSPPEVSQLLGISRGAAYQLFHMRSFPAIHLGRRLLVSRDQLRKWLEVQVENSVPYLNAE